MLDFPVLTIRREFVNIITIVTVITYMNTGIQISEARKQLGELVNEAYYTGKAVQLARGDKSMAFLIGTKEFTRMLKIIEAHDPGLADTIAILSNPEVQQILDEGERDIEEGRLISLDEAINEP